MWIWICISVYSVWRRKWSRRRPLLVVGKGAAFSQADVQLRRLVDALGAPFLATAMGRGVVPDRHPLSANAARSTALRSADVAIIFGARCVMCRCQHDA